MTQSTVLARKWRPQTFSDLLGQTHVVKALSYGLEQDRLHHAYLFTGTRGVGKTTIARIIAKSLNCQEGKSVNPCGQCSSCKAIEEGRYPDLIEIDAASRTKVEDTREILDNVQYAPTQGQYKIYLIDEVHMLSNASFNALLKTLEEPPEHVIFLLATTDPHKLLPTVLSRCMQFGLKRLSIQQLYDHLQHILTAEGHTADEAALKLIAKMGDGSVRDSLSLLDQAIAFSGSSHISTEQVQQMIGLVDELHLVHLVQALLNKEAEEVQQQLQALATLGLDYHQLLQQLQEIFYWLTHQQLLQDTPEELLSATLSQFIQQWADMVSPEQVQLLYQIGLHGNADFYHAPSERIAFEMTILRMLAFQPLEATATAQDTAVVLTHSEHPPSSGAAVLDHLKKKLM